MLRRRRCISGLLSAVIIVIIAKAGRKPGKTASGELPVATGQPKTEPGDAVTDVASS